MSLLADLLTTLVDQRLRFGGGGSDTRSIEDRCRDLLSSQGEISGYTLACTILDDYEAMDDAAKMAFFRFLVAEMDIDATAVRAALNTYEIDGAPDAFRAFVAAAEPARQELARRLNQAPGSTARLVAMRADLLRFIDQAPELATLDHDFRHLLASWFNRGFLLLRPVSWESPAHILEKIIAYEAVHEIGSWDELRSRLQPSDRRCFAFFHPAMPDEPLIFVEVALTNGVPSAIHDVLAADRSEIAAEDADTATFYSISNCQAGLAGISFGNSLIKQVVDDLSRELPQLTTFVTLSPIPGLARWMRSEKLSADTDDALCQMAAHYLLRIKRPSGRPLDAVAGFHLRNGAAVLNVHAQADLSERGLGQSHGAMVNYHYDLKRIGDRHEAFAESGVIAATSQVEKLAAQPLPSGE